MLKRLIVADRRVGAVAPVVVRRARASLEQPRHDSERNSLPQTGPAPPRDLTGTWDAGGAGIAPRGSPTSPLTPWGEKKISTYKPGDGPRAPSVIGEINDPLSTMCDPAGFPRNLLFELRPFQVVHTPNQVLMLYMFEKRFRTIWTDGRALPQGSGPALVRLFASDGGRTTPHSWSTRLGWTRRRGSTTPATRIATTCASKSDITA